MIARKLGKWDVIWIASPSWVVWEDLEQQLKQGIAFLEKLWFKVNLGNNVMSNTLKYSATPQEKADDINQMFADKEVKAIVCTQGGFNSNSVLPLLDFENIKKNPKVFQWFSDITVLLNAIYTKTWLITFLWTDLIWWYGLDCSDYEKEALEKRLLLWEIWQITKNKDRYTIREGIVEWVALWWNLTALCKLIWTPFQPDFSDKILLLEDFDKESPPDLVDSYLHQLKQLWVFEKVCGLWLWEYSHESKIPYEEIVMNVVKDYNFPILKCNDFGHNTVNTTIPIGGKIRLDATNKEVIILEKIVE